MSWDLWYWYSKRFFFRGWIQWKLVETFKRRLKSNQRRSKQVNTSKKALLPKLQEIMKQPEPIKTEPKTKTHPTSSVSIYHQAKFSPAWCSTGPRSSFYIVQSFVLFNQTQITEIEGNFLISFSLSGCEFAWKALSYLLESESELATKLCLTKPNSNQIHENGREWLLDLPSPGRLCICRLHHFDLPGFSFSLF